MKEKLKAFFDSKSTWLTLGLLGGSIFGKEVAFIINGVGAVVMAVL